MGSCKDYYMASTSVIESAQSHIVPLQGKQILKRFGNLDISTLAVEFF